MTFIVYASKLWNNLPKTLRNFTSVNSFKKALKTDLYAFNLIAIHYVLCWMYI